MLVEVFEVAAKEVKMRRVRELLRQKGGGTDVVTVTPDTPLRTAVHLLMRHRIGGLPVLGMGGEPVGMLSERDVVRAVERDTEAPIGHLPVSTVMRRPVPTCSADDRVHDAMGRMTRERFRHLVVLGDDGRIQGVISVGDLVKHRLQELELEAGVLRDYVAARRAAT